MIKEIKDLICEHREILNSFLKQLPDETSGASDSDGNDENEEKTIIEDRLEYLKRLENGLEPCKVEIDYPNIFGERLYRGELAHQINKFNEDLLKLIKPFAMKILFNHPMPSFSEVCGILEHNSVIRSLSISAWEFDANILLSSSFVDALNSAPNFYLFKACVYKDGEEDEVNETDVCEFLTGKIDANKALLIEWTCGKFFVKNAGQREVYVITFEDIYGSDGDAKTNIDGNFSLEQFNACLEEEKSFDIRLIYRGIGAGYVKYNGEVDRECYSPRPPKVAKIDYRQEFDTWRLVDYASRYGDVLVIREILRGEADISEQNSAKVRPLEIAAEFGCPRSITALLGLSFPIDGKVEVSAMVREHLERRSSTGGTLLSLAAKAGKIDNIFLLLQLGVELDIACSAGLTPVQHALCAEHYESAELLLKMGAKFPADICHVNNEAIKTLCQERTRIGQLIEAGKIMEIEELILSGNLQSKFLTVDNHSAPYVAFVAKQFKIYAFLRAKGFPIFNAELSTVRIDLLTNPEKIQLKRDMIESVNKLSYSTVIFLLSKSRVLQPDPHYFEDLKKIFTALTDIPQIKVILEVLECSGRPLDIIFDFESENVEEISVSVGVSVAGSCNFKSGRIFIGGKVEYPELLGIVAHELTHQAMQILYNNTCNPFKKEDSNLKKQLEEAIKEAKAKGVNKIITRVFTRYFYPNWEAEIIVRVPQMLAEYGEHDGNSYLTEQSPLLLKFYTDNIVPQCSAYVTAILQRGFDELKSPEMALSMIHFESRDCSCSSVVSFFRKHPYLITTTGAFTAVAVGVKLLNVSFSDSGVSFCLTPKP